MNSTTNFQSDSSTNQLGSEPTQLISVKQEIGRVIVGQEQLLDRLLVALLVGGHILLEGVPGLAKTRTLVCLSEVISGTMHRVQFTPDLLPSDIIGTELFRPQTGQFELRRGPIFANLVLADEINRAPAKVQSALLEAMAERQVTIGTQRLRLPVPFMVLATQNPIEQSGTYELPEAQLDRFLMKLIAKYPTFEEEVSILGRHCQSTSSFAQKDSFPEGSGLDGNAPHQKLNKLLTPALIIEQGQKAAQLFVDPRIDAYIVRLIQATRSPADVGLGGIIQWGASPRKLGPKKLCPRPSVPQRERLCWARRGKRGRPRRASPPNCAHL